jgi:L-ascorbate metabolism protein UlaG (beta-lactamase superfamily)
MQLGDITVNWLGHSSVAIYGEKCIYIDPFSPVLTGGEPKADIIISTHGHKDHFDPDAINRLLHENTQVVLRPGCEVDKLNTRNTNEIEINASIYLGDVRIQSVPAYNVKRFRSPGIPFHPEGFGMGAVVTFQGIKFYYAGDTDFIDAMKKLKSESIDVAFVPIGGTYTMDVDEAAEAIAAIAPKQVVPVHFGHIPGTEADPNSFKEKVESNGISRVTIIF